MLNSQIYNAGMFFNTRTKNERVNEYYLFSNVCVYKNRGFEIAKQFVQNIISLLSHRETFDEIPRDDIPRKFNRM